jgi:trk system potassium uptake protein TrkH
MAVGTLFSMVINRRIGFRERMILSEAISLDSVSGVVRLTRSIIICVAVFETAGAVLLAFRFVPVFGAAGGIYKAIFHSVSAFCNAGIDLMGEVGRYSSLTSFVHDPIVNFTIMALIVIGGLGFTVWEDLYRFRQNRRLRLHTKLVLIISGILIAAGFVLFFVFEYSNPETIASFTLPQKIQAALFQSVTARTAGFNTVNLSAMREQSILIMIMLMLVGGSPGSTAGGIKTTTVGLLVISAMVVARGSSKVHIFGKRISENQIMRALAIIILSIIIVSTGVTVLLAADNLTMKDAIFETASAFGTVGLTLGITSKLGAVSKITLIMLMYLGRVGVMTAAMAITKRQHTYDERITYPVETILF